MCRGQSGPWHMAEEVAPHQPHEEQHSMGEPLPSTQPPAEVPRGTGRSVVASPPVRCKGTCDAPWPGAACEKTLVPWEHLSQLL